MNKIDKMLLLAKGILIKTKAVIYPDDDDDFVKSLGVDIKKYEVKNIDGSIGYDYIRALNDSAIEDWKDEEQGYKSIKTTIVKRKKRKKKIIKAKNKEVNLEYDDPEKASLFNYK